ncbi:GtrA family protein [Blastomonas sp. AAP53]|uniref:GtrA family protein n=1 Tax=Blastomonas sp. AAP53 TaxID=1248760 RepID=UPI0002FB85AB|nr:GtrA family protein [Blastomonas sp. AAP53]
MIRPLAKVSARVRDIRFLRYLAASVGALGIDVGTFLACLALGMAAGLASAIGYSLGIIAHWLFSSRAVFQGSLAVTGRARMLQKLLFVVSTLAGLALTTLIVTAADRAGFDPRPAKMVAIAASFLLTYIVRSQIVFKDAGR